jgi:hypothetical protein
MADNMSSNIPPRSPFAGFTLFAVVLALAVIVLPLLFGRTMIVSPLLLLAIAVIPNFIAYLIPSTDENGGHALFSRTFYLRLVASVASAMLLLAIERIAYALA